MIDKKNPTIIQMIAVLLVISVVCSAAVAAVYAATKDTIDKQRAEAEQQSLKVVLPEFDNNPSKDTTTIKVGDNSCLCYTATKNGKPVAYAIKSSNNDGYNGKVEVLTGFSLDGKIINTTATHLAETPGLGQKAIEAPFHDQFNGKSPAEYKLTVKKDGGDVDAITAATITSRAYSRAVQTAYNALMTKLGNKVDANSGATSSAKPKE